MRQEFCEDVTKAEAEEQCPWAARVEEVEGGCMCFESVSDYETWANQQ